MVPAITVPRRRGSRLRDQAGQATVEMALVLPFLLLLLLGIAEFGRLLSAYLTVQNAAREGARYGITIYGDAGFDGKVEAKVKEHMATLPDYDAGTQVTVGPPSPRQPGDDLWVNVRYDFKFMVPFFVPDVTVHSAVYMRI